LRCASVPGVESSCRKFFGDQPSTAGEPVKTMRTVFGGAVLAADCRKGSMSCVKRYGARAFVPIAISYPCSVLALPGQRPTPALFHSMWSLLSCEAKAEMAVLMLVRSARSRGMNVMEPVE